jgi:hypothetical protein
MGIMARRRQRQAAETKVIGEPVKLNEQTFAPPQEPVSPAVAEAPVVEEASGEVAEVVKPRKGKNKPGAH